MLTSLIVDRVLTPTIPHHQSPRIQYPLLGSASLLLCCRPEFCRHDVSTSASWHTRSSDRCDQHYLSSMPSANTTHTAPALTMYTSMWYTRAESTPRYGLWYCGLGTGQIIGGLISFAAQHAPASMSFHGWRIMFVVIGAVNVLVALLVLFILPDTLSEARFLSTSEKVRVEERLRQDQAGVGEKVFRAISLLEAFADLQTALLVLLTILITIPSGVITTFSSILIKDFGYDSKESALLNMPSGVVSIVATMASTMAIAWGYSRWLAINVLLIPTLLGACLMSFLPSSNQGGCLAGIYLVNTVGCASRKSDGCALTGIDCCTACIDFRVDWCKLQGVYHEGKRTILVSIQ